MKSKQPQLKVKYSAFAEFSHLPYFRNIPKDGRIAFLNPMFDEKNNDWILLFPVKPDKLQRLAVVEPILTCYMGFQPADPSKDFELPLGTFVIQHLSFPGVLGALFAIETDFHNCSAVLEKYLLVTLQDKSQRGGMSLLLRTELEYLVSTIRSIYDQMQKLSKHASALVVNLEEPGRRLIASLPDSFSDIVLHGDQLRMVEEIRDKFRLPPALADFYASEAPYFKWLRELRVAIEHHGQTISTIFDLDEGAAISIQDNPWNSLPVWDKKEYIRHDHLGSLHAVFVFLVAQAIEMTTRYINAFINSVNVIPQAIEPGMKVYIRNHFSHHLVALNNTIDSPWERLKRQE